MPKIKIDHIISFSSEDPVHVASNILSEDSAKKWKCATVGEKSATVVLQLEKACVITGIDVGNEHSAYIEVFVSRSGKSENWKVLLVMSSLMTPLEARQSQNVNKVRMFTKEHFSKPECDEKWDKIKMVCTQPFNRHVQYGLSFTNLSTFESKPVANPVQTIGKFTLRPDSPDDLSAGSLFARRKELQEQSLKGAAAIREASSSAQNGSPIIKPKLKLTPKRKSEKAEVNESPKPRNRDELLYDKDEEDSSEKIDRIIEMKAKEKQEKQLKDIEKQSSPAVSKEILKPKIDNKKIGKVETHPTLINSPSTSGETGNKMEKKNIKRKQVEIKSMENKKPKKEVITKSFHRLLEDVVIVISGIENPDRAVLRATALSMGSKYKRDWDSTCTHLICAFINTPKFHQVKGKGKIVTRKWLEECNRLRKKLPWRRYALDKSDMGEESEDEICETVELISSVKEPSDNTDDEIFEDGSDTEERVAKIQASQKKLKQNRSDIYSAETDEENDNDAGIVSAPDIEKNTLSDYFEDKNFYIDESFDEEMYNKIKRYIVAYKGLLAEQPTGKVDVIITVEENSSTLKEINTEAVCVSPDWIWDCHNKQSIVSVTHYIL